MKFNINNLVKVKLNEYGKKIIRDGYAECGIKDYEVKIDHRGYTEFQLHDLMSLFGKEMYCGNMNLPFDTTIIIECSYLESE